jgi:hypothetical protein
MELAKAGDIGFYSHELDVMMSEELEFEEPKGLVEQFLTDGVLDWQGLKKAWKESSQVLEVAVIANKFFNVENMDEHPKLAAALMEAYQQGKLNGSKKIISNQRLNEGFYG